MKCDKSNDKKHKPMKHMLMMGLCCGLPILIVGILPLLNIGVGAKTMLASITPFICPIMMVLMIPMMFRNMKDGACCGEKKEQSE
ncbi:hypothetical protein J2Z44_002617 [Clostridium punense]|uniref:DUF2933 domain-containing protein n=1 Tax=Clostridium punense TaxID=1054297 RepID=A0ABS4K4S8_9CLOT|nr:MULTISPECIES: hypothetical protein [Clostridium]EQB88649.1 hypothetical protein M918_23795 [Clostridium sp. BL8]MBP2022794.1 hypothetical protein [Clostridium punense]